MLVIKVNTLHVCQFLSIKLFDSRTAMGEGRVEITKRTIQSETEGIVFNCIAFE